MSPMHSDARIIEVFVIYAHPLDAPDGFVVRRQLVEAGEIHIDLGPPKSLPTLSAARAAVPHEAGTCIGRMEEDDPCIVEVWL